MKNELADGSGNTSIKTSEVKPDKWIFQPVSIGGHSSYLIYTPADNDPEGKFVQEDGGLVWFSKKFPNGEPCKTRVVTKEEGDILLALATKPCTRSGSEDCTPNLIS
jgi:hypothetical protein